MTTDQTTTEATEATEETAETAETETTETTEKTQETTTDESGDRSEAKLRKRAQTAETERDALAGTVTALRQQLATSALADVLAKPSALWETAGLDIAEYTDETGAIDTEALRAAAKDAITTHGLGAFHRFQGGADGGVRGRGIGTEKPDAVAEAAKAIRGGR